MKKGVKSFSLTSVESSPGLDTEMSPDARRETVMVDSLASKAFLTRFQMALRIRSGSIERRRGREESRVKMQEG